MLSIEQAQAKVQRTRDDYDGLRRAMETFWTLAILYDTGKQWGFTTSNHGMNVIHQLKQIINPDRGDVRVTMNTIHGAIKEMMARTSPQAIASFARPRTGSTSDTLVAGLGGTILDNWLATHQGLNFLRETQRTRFVLGTSIIKRTLSSRGPGKFIQQAAEDADKDKPLRIRDFDLRWSHVMPWEIIRDPASVSIDPERDEEIVIHEKPRTTEWVQRNFGVQIKTQTKMGFLLSHHRHIHNAYGMGTGAYVHQSTVPAVMWYEAYFKDPKKKGWDTMFVGYSDPQTDARKIHKVAIMPNPMFRLPYHFFTYDRAVQSPWGIGVPHLAMAMQDLTNLAWTWIMRIQQAGAGKLMFEKGTIDRPEIILNSRMDQPIAFDRKATGVSAQFVQAPTRLLPPPISPVTPQILGLAPQWMDKALNLSEVARGVTSKRGESGKAVEEKLRAASAPLDQLRKDDDMIYQRLLYGTMADITNPKRFRLDIAKKMLGPDASQDNIRLMMRHPVVRAVKEIVILPLAMHPKTHTELQDEAIALTGAQIIDGEAAEWAMIDREISKDKKRSKQKQELEIEQMISGQDVAPNVFDDHRYHIRQLRMFIDSMRWMAMPAKAKKRINEHAAGHFASLQQMESLLNVQGQQGQQGSPPAAAFGQGGPEASAPGSAGPAVGVA